MKREHKPDMSNPFAVAQKYLDDRQAAPRETDPMEGEVVAVLIDSTVLGAPIWFALREDWRPDPGDTTPVFYASELPFLRTKSPEQLRAIFNVKTAFAAGIVRQ
jgi:hypothetical protein